MYKSDLFYVSNNQKQLITLIDNGVIVEIGKHEELIAKQGAYYSLVNSQM